MKFCLSGRQPREYIKKADELMVEYRDRNYIYDIIEINPEATITISIPTDTKVEWNSLNQYKTICRDQFRIASYDYSVLAQAKERNFKFFSLVSARVGYQLFAFISFGVCAVRISGQLSHQLDMIRDNTDIEIRAVINNPDPIFDYRPLIGSYFRPEDIEKIDAIDVCEFHSMNDVRREQALYRIYAEQHKWPGRLAEIIPNIEDKEIMNSLFPEDFYERRANCRQVCVNGGQCHYCERSANFAKEAFANLVKEALGQE